MNFKDDFPYTPAVEENKYSAPFISLLRLDKVVTEKIGNLTVEVKPDSLTLVIMNNKGQNIQHIVFENDGNLSFKLSKHPVLGMGEGQNYNPLCPGVPNQFSSTAGEQWTVCSRVGKVMYTDQEIR